ncbi:MAG: chorismate mutase/prephenate dehydratase [Gammaproteobacteria bacterium]|jgi:chorismate mutase/prephenate dehydratase
MAKELDTLREKIDAIDTELIRLINERAAVAIEVGELKRSSDGNAVFYRPEREAEILRRVIARNPGPLPAPEAARLMREVMSACLGLEHPLTVAYLGPEGTYTHLASLKHFGGSINGIGVASIDEVMREVEVDGAHYGVVPVENSLEGGINQTLDALRESPLKICGEVVLNIHHQLLSVAHKLEEIKRVYAHPQALAQCRRWLAINLPGVECSPSSSNGEAARKVRDEVDAAAIASEVAAGIYGLSILRKNIEDEPGNTTRFVVLGVNSPPPSGRDLTSLMFTTANRPGALHEILSIFASENISMTRIESRPLRREAWDYVFFVDIEGHVDVENVRDTLERVEQKTSSLKILGSYPRAAI